MLTGLALMWLATVPSRAAKAEDDPQQRAEALERYPDWNIPAAGDWPRVRARRARADLWQSMKQYGKARAELRAAFD